MPYTFNRTIQVCMAGAPLLGVGYNRYFKSAGQLYLNAGACLVRKRKYRAGDENRIGRNFSVFDSVVEAVELAPGG